MYKSTPQSLYADLHPTNTTHCDWLGAVVTLDSKAVQLAPVRIFACDGSLRAGGSRIIRQGVWLSGATGAADLHGGAVARITSNIADNNVTLTLRHDTPLPFLGPGEHEDVLLNALWAIFALPHRAYFPWFALERAVTLLEGHASPMVRREAKSTLNALSRSGLTLYQEQRCHHDIHHDDENSSDAPTAKHVQPLNSPKM